MLTNNWVITEFCLQVLIAAAVCTKGGKSKCMLCKICLRSINVTWITKTNTIADILINTNISILYSSSNDIAAIRRDDESPNRRAAGCLSEADDSRQTAHLCRNGFCALRVPAHGEAVHVVDHHKGVKHLGGFGDAATFLKSGRINSKKFWFLQ